MPLRAAVVGFGKMGMLHSSILRAMPGVELVAVVEPQPLFRYFGPRVVRTPFRKSLQQCLDKDAPDVVYVTTPTSSHPALAEQSLEAGCGVFVEKPLGPTVASCDALLATARRRSGQAAMVGYCKRFVPTFAEAGRLLQEQAIGDVRSFHAVSAVAQVFEAGKGWRASHAGGGGALAVIGCHALDLLRWYFGEAVSCEGTATALYSEAVEDEFQGRLSMRDGIEGTLDVSWSRPGHRVLETSIEVQGSRGSLLVTDDLVKVTQNGQAPRTTHKHSLSRPLPIDLGGPEYCAESQAFLQAASEGHAAPIPLDDAYKTQLLIERLQAVKLQRGVPA